MKGLAGPLLFVALIAVVFIYYRQSGAPDTGSLGGLGDIADRAPGAGDVANGVADGAKTGANKAADDVTPWVVRNGTVVAALACAGVALWFWKKYRTLSLIILTGGIVGVLVMLAT